MSEKIYFTHSGGINNSNIQLDLGGYKSQFQLAVNPLNNLFEDISPEENSSGYTDYKCIYANNQYENLLLLSPEITLSNQASGGSDIEIGVIQQNEIQRITINGTPDEGGYIILQTEFGPSFNVYYETDLATFASNLENTLQQNYFCSTCTATLTIPSLPNLPYIDIEFKGLAGNRNTQLIKLIANRLISTASGSFLPSNYTTADYYNHIGDSVIKVNSVLDLDEDSYAASGPIYVYNATTGLYDELEYNFFDPILKEFNLTLPLNYGLGVLPPDSSTYICYNYVYIPTLEKNVKISIKKIVEGSPINTISNYILKSTISPLGVSFSSGPITLEGVLFAQESIPIWIKRSTTANIAGKTNDSFYLSLLGTLISP